jgi:hypothetical protein
MTEHIRILTGTPAEVESALAAAFAEHPNTTILSSSYNVSRSISGSVIADTEKPASKPGKPKGKAEEPPTESKHKAKIEVTTHEHLCVIIGRKF